VCAFIVINFVSGRKKEELATRSNNNLLRSMAEHNNIFEMKNSRNKSKYVLLCRDGYERRVAMKSSTSRMKQITILFARRQVIIN